MRKLAQPIILLCLSLAIPASLLADRAHNLAKVATKQKAVTGCNPGSLTTQSCHAQFPTGCTDSRSKYDAYLNFLKNQAPGAGMASTVELGDTDFKTLESKVPSGTTSKNHAKLAPTLANLGEGDIVTVIAYLYFVENTGKGSGGNPSVGETTNCKLQLPDSYDFHIGLGFDKTLADQILKTKTQPIFGKPTAMDKTSVVAEMTPHTRGAKWTFERVNSLQGQQVKVVGQLMMDNVHWNAKDDCGFASAGPGCWRSTIWEVHPVTQFYVCKVSGGCTASSPASDWTSLDQVP